MITEDIIRTICSFYGIKTDKIGEVIDTSRNASDQRYIYPINDAYMLKVSNSGTITEEYLNDIDKLTRKYRNIGVYCPFLIKNRQNQFSCSCNQGADTYTCYIEEMACYRQAEPTFFHNLSFQMKVLRHLGILASRYTNTDLSNIKSMWSIIDLAPLDTSIDEKQENLNRLLQCLKKHGLENTAAQAARCNDKSRGIIKAYFDDLPRCVYQGDLNYSNILVNEDNSFRGLLDFNMSGTEVNINCFLNETTVDPSQEDYGEYSASELLERMLCKQNELLSVIWENYSLTETEKICLPEYRKIIFISQYPIITAWINYLYKGIYTDKICELIRLITEL